MSTKPVECLHCGQTREGVKRNQTICATVDYFGECQDEWPQHRWSPWTNTELTRWNISESRWAACRRLNEAHLVFEMAASACDREGHRMPVTDFAGPDNCPRCFARINSRPSVAAVETPKENTK